MCNSIYRTIGTWKILKAISFHAMFCTTLFSASAQNLIRNPSFDACYNYYDLNHNLVYQPKDWYYTDSLFNHPIYFSTDRYLNKSLSWNVHPDSARINRGEISNYISVTVLPNTQSTITDLKESLKKNTRYRFSLDIKASEQSNYFSDILVGFKSSPGPNLDSCLYRIRLEIPDSLCDERLYHEWITLSTVFTATGQEKYMLVLAGTPKAYLEIIHANPEKFLITRFQGPPKIKYYVDNISLTENVSEPKIVTKFDTLKTGDRVILSNIYFNFDKFYLRESSIPELEMVFSYLSKNTAVNILVSGHTDNFGTDAYNAALSENRARAVMIYLINRGISPDRMQAKGFGSTLPIDTNGTSAGRQNNRRIEMEILQ